MLQFNKGRFLHITEYIGNSNYDSGIPEIEKLGGHKTHKILES